MSNMNNSKALKSAIAQLDWYFSVDDGQSAEDITQDSYLVLKEEIERANNEKQTQYINIDTMIDITYIVGKLDGIMSANCSFDASEIQELLTPIRDNLSSIVKGKVVRNEIP